MKSSKHQFDGQGVKLGDVATYINGYAFKPADYSLNGKQIIRIQDLTGNAYQTNNFAGELDDKYLVSSGDVLISWSASLGVFEWNKEEAWLNQHIFKVVFNKLPVDKRYFIHQARYVINRGAMLAHGATMRHLTKKVFESLPFSYPNRSEQLTIAKRLDDIQRQIYLAEKQISKLDSLVKSRFVEMFGDPCDANGNRAKVKVASICELRIGPFGSALHKNDYISGGHPLINPSHIIGSSIIPDADLTVSDDKYKSLEAYHLLPGDIVLGRRGEIGRCAVVQDKGFLCGTGSMVLRPRAGVRSEYLQRVVSFPSFRQALERNAVGVTMKNLNAKIVGAADMYLPSINQQDDFISFTKQVDKSRFGGMLRLLNSLSGIMHASFFSVADTD
ncbi:restriction endonuclease subunit S [Bifidobacterium adolescentis]|uniref:restriction endonuclease subunit S n=1 Tax=Bifidobacterium adolescentis TaxID=1680 RepID=UPI003BB5BD8A